MAGGKCAYLQKALLDLPAGAAAWTPAGTLYIALSTAIFSPASTGSALTEVSSSGTAYSRVAVTNNLTNWPAVVLGVSSKSNATVFTYPAATATWSTILSFYLVDASSAGNCYYGADLAASRTVLTGDTASFGNGSIVLVEV